MSADYEQYVHLWIKQTSVGFNDTDRFVEGLESVDTTGVARNDSNNC